MSDTTDDIKEARSVAEPTRAGQFIRSNPAAFEQLLRSIDELVEPSSHVAALFAGMRQINCQGWIVEYLSALLRDDVINSDDGLPWFGHLAACVRDSGGTLPHCPSPIPIEPALRRNPTPTS